MSTEYVTLRAELKAWEKEFQSKHGRKATPDDIKLVDGLGKYCNVANLYIESDQVSIQCKNTRDSRLSPSLRASNLLLLSRAALRRLVH